METVEFTHVVYTLIAVLLAANAYFVKGLVASINEVKLELAKLVSQHDNSKEKIADHSEDLRDLYKLTNKQESRLSIVETKLEKLMSNSDS